MPFWRVTRWNFLGYLKFQSTSMIIACCNAKWNFLVKNVSQVPKPQASESWVCCEGEKCSVSKAREPSTSICSRLSGISNGRQAYKAELRELCCRSCTALIEGICKNKPETWMKCSNSTKSIDAQCWEEENDVGTRNVSYIAISNVYCIKEGTWSAYIL